MRICLVASSRFPVSQPFHGGLEAHTATLAAALLDRGHRVTVFAAPGSDPRLNVTELPVLPFGSSEAARSDVGAPPEEWMREHHAYLGLMLELARAGRRRYDIVHNNSLHHLPLAMAEATGIPLVTTLHTPPVPWLESAVQYAPDTAAFVAVSRHTARAWSHAVDAEVVLNGVDTQTWAAGPGGGPAIWSGRLVPEKAPHLAARAALRAGLEIDLVGPVQDRDYFEREVRPLLGPQVRYLGHLGTDDLARLVGRARVALVTPEWDEPYGLVAAEALSCGTPVAAFARGALPEVLCPAVGVLASPGDVPGLARAALEAATLDRASVRSHATRWCGVDRMVEEYEAVYERVSPTSLSA